MLQQPQVTRGKPLIGGDHMYSLGQPIRESVLSIAETVTVVPVPTGIERAGGG